MEFVVDSINKTIYKGVPFKLSFRYKQKRENMLDELPPLTSVVIPYFQKYGHYDQSRRFVLIHPVLSCHVLFNFLYKPGYSIDTIFSLFFKPLNIKKTK